MSVWVTGALLCCANETASGRCVTIVDIVSWSVVVSGISECPRSGS